MGGRHFLPNHGHTIEETTAITITTTMVMVIMSIMMMTSTSISSLTVKHICYPNKTAKYNVIFVRVFLDFGVSLFLS